MKVLDFGLAKMASRSGAGTESGDSPTLTIEPDAGGSDPGHGGVYESRAGRGKPVDKRADIWAFGVVLYEMFTGRMAFRGETITDVLAAVVTKEPDLTRVPTKVRRLLQLCLQKDPRQRLQAIGDWRLLLEDAPQATPRRYARAIALAAGGYPDVGTAATHRHAYPGQREVERDTWQQFHAALKTEAQLSSRSSASTFCSTRKYSLESVRLYQDASERHRKSDPKRGFRHRYAVHETRTSTKDRLPPTPKVSPRSVLHVYSTIAIVDSRA